MFSVGQFSVGVQEKNKQTNKKPSSFLLARAAAPASSPFFKMSANRKKTTNLTDYPAATVTELTLMAQIS